MTSRCVDTGVVNFVVAGELRSGSAIVQGTIDSLPGAVCHANLFHPDEEVRRACHEGYFGPSRDPKKLPEWYVPGETNPYQYINHRVLDNPLNDEHAIGLRITYDTIRRFELYDLFRERCVEGDFCLVHVVRNPVACFVSQKQAEKTGVWRRGLNDPPSSCIPMSVSVDPEELTTFVRNWVGTQRKIDSSCDDRLVVRYKDLFLNFQRVIRSVIDFLELPDPPMPIAPPTKRLRNRSMRERISNFTRLRFDVPSDVKAFIDARDLY